MRRFTHDISPEHPHEGTSVLRVAWLRVSDLPVHPGTFRLHRGDACQTRQVGNVQRSARERGTGCIFLPLRARGVRYLGLPGLDWGRGH